MRTWHLRQSTPPFAGRCATLRLAPPTCADSKPGVNRWLALAARWASRGARACECLGSYGWLLSPRALITALDTLARAPPRTRW